MTSFFKLPGFRRVLLFASLYLFSLPFFTNTGNAKAQVIPADGDTVNFRLVGFSFPVSDNKGNVDVEIARGFFSSVDSFQQNILLTLRAQGNKVIGAVPDFGMQYTWRVVPMAGKKSKNATVLHYFTTGSSPDIDTNVNRMRVVKPAVQYGDAVVFSDRNKVLYDMKGNPLWFLPHIKGVVNDNTPVRNLRASTAGTITFLANNMPYEIDYHGKILWHPPYESGMERDTAERYHHEFKRLKNGNYMVMGNDLVFGQWVTSETGAILTIVPRQVAVRNPGGFVKMKLATLLEYDKNDSLLWSWKAADHFSETRGAAEVPASGEYGNHENSFSFDEGKKVIYISYKNTDQIVKIKYPEGTVLNVFNNEEPAEQRVRFPASEKLFANQHSCKIAKSGDLYLFSNNMDKPGALPTIVKLRERIEGTPGLEKIWEYQYPVNLNTDGAKIFAGGGNVFTNGGNVIELEDESLFVSMCHPFGNLFIINKDKKLLWDAVMEKRNATTGNWEETDQYRGSIISKRSLLEQIIWGTGPVKVTVPAGKARGARVGQH